VKAHPVERERKKDGMSKKSANFWLVILIVYQVAAIPLVIKYLPIFLSKNFTDAFLPLGLNGAIIYVLYFTYANSKKNEVVEGLNLGSFEKAKKFGISLFPVTAYRFKDMLFSFSFLRSNASIYNEFTDGLGGAVLVFWFPQALGAIFSINNLPYESRVLSIRKGSITYQPKATWEYLALLIPNTDYAKVRWAAAGPNLGDLLLTDQTIEKITAFAETISKYEGRFRIGERGLSAVFPSNPNLNPEVLERGYELWNEFKGKNLPQVRYNPFRSAWNIFIFLLILLVVLFIGGSIAYEIYSGGMKF
jgi:hypothetical protein